MSWRRTAETDSSNGVSSQKRIKILAIIFVVVAALIIWRLFNLQVLRGGFYAALAMGQHELYQKLFPERGSIYVVENDGDRQTLFPLVTNRDLNMLYAVPANIENPRTVARHVINILGLPQKFDPEELEEIEKELFADISPELEPKMIEEIKQIRRDKWQDEQKEIEIDRLAGVLAKRDDPYEPVRHRLTDEQVEQIKALEIDGLGFQKETWRFYPEQGMGGHIFGFWGFAGDQRQGLYGLEGYFDNVLAGQLGEIRSEQDVWGNIIAVGSHSFKEKMDGSDLVLTIDRAIQYKVCKALYEAVDYFEAEKGSVIVMNPKTGAVLSMCSAPDYNPDEYYSVESINVYNNPAIFDAYEPGSIFKPITMAAALDSGKVEPGTTYEDKGSVTIGQDKITNFRNKVYGVSTMTSVLENSINTGAVWAMGQATPKVFAKYVHDFGFGEKTGVGLSTEVAGDISNLDRKGEIYAATASYGHGIMVTPLQMLSAISAIANTGKLMESHLVSQIVSSDGEIESFEPKELRQVISSKAARMLSAMMVSVVESGHAQAASVDGYRVAGKTGTALIAKEDGRGYTEDVITSFVGFAPFADPKFAMIVRIDKPQYGKTGASVAAPIFGDVAKFILRYYNVPHDK